MRMLLDELLDGLSQILKGTRRGLSFSILLPLTLEILHNAWFFLSWPQTSIEDRHCALRGFNFVNSLI
jgi:hypothetical protein